MMIFLAALSTIVFAQTHDPISRVRDQFTSQAQAVLEKACPGAPHYLCRLQLESDCRKNSEEACKHLKTLKALEEKAIQSDLSINSFVKIPFYKEPLPVKKAKVGMLKLGSPKPRKELGADEDYKTLVSQRDRLAQTEIQLQCEGINDCHAQAVGHKVCGGPLDYLILSKKDPNFGKISAEINLMNFMDATLQRRMNLAGTCDYVSAPELACVKGVCQKK